MRGPTHYRDMTVVMTTAIHVHDGGWTMDDLGVVMAGGHSVMTVGGHGHDHTVSHMVHWPRLSTVMTMDITTDRGDHHGHDHHDNVHQPSCPRSVVTNTVVMTTVVTLDDRVHDRENA